MATKTITITEAAYGLLAENKVEDESFSQEITRIFIVQKKKRLLDFFGILSDKEGEDIMKAIEMKKAMNVRLLKRRLGEFQ